jgi:hypothetical protein
MVYYTLQFATFKNLTPCGGIVLATNELVKLPNALPTRGVAKISKTAHRSVLPPVFSSSSGDAPAPAAVPSSQARGSESNSSSIDCAPLAVRLAADPQSLHGASIGRLARRFHPQFLDKIRRDIGKSQSIWNDSKMETARSLGRAAGCGAVAVEEHHRHCQPTQRLGPALSAHRLAPYPVASKARPQLIHAQHVRVQQQVHQALLHEPLPRVCQTRSRVRGGRVICQLSERVCQLSGASVLLTVAEYQRRRGHRIQREVCLGLFPGEDSVAGNAQPAAAETTRKAGRHSDRQQSMPE